jgi:hypothetical protein
LGEVSNKNALPEMGRHLIFWSRVLFKRLYFEKINLVEGDLLSAQALVIKLYGLI